MSDEKPITNSDLLTAAGAVLRMHLDNVEVHPCDEFNDRVRASSCVSEVQNLYQAVEHARGFPSAPTAADLATAIEQRYRPNAHDRAGRGEGDVLTLEDIGKELRSGGYAALMQNANLPA